MSVPLPEVLSNDWVLHPHIGKLIRDQAYEMCNAPGFSESDRPDIEQDLFVHLLSRTAFFDPSRGNTVAFARRLIENEAVSIARKKTALKCTCRRNKRSLNEAVRDKEGREVQLADTMDTSMGRRHTGQRRRGEAELTQLRMDVAEANRRLPTPLREVAALLSHVSEFAVSEVLGISRRQTAECVATLRELYEERGLNG